MTTDPIEVIRELLTTISNEEKLMSFSSAGENDGSEMKAHLARHIRAQDALAALETVRSNYLPNGLEPTQEMALAALNRIEEMRFKEHSDDLDKMMHGLRAAFLAAVKAIGDV